MFREAGITETTKVHELGSNGDGCGKRRREREAVYERTVGEDNVQLSINVNNVQLLRSGVGGVVGGDLSRLVSIDNIVCILSDLVRDFVICG